MNAKRKLFRAGVVAALCAVPSAAWAANCAGTNINNLVSWDQTEIAKGVTLAVMRITSVTVADDRRAPYHMVSGECIGSVLYTPDGRAQASGFCARRDKDGDVLNEEWASSDPKVAIGTWKLAGGTGKFAKAAGTANWEFSALQGKLASVRWSGTCQ